MGLEASEASLKFITYRFSPYAQRVNIALLEKGIPFEPISVEFHKKPQILLDSNPIWKKVPVLIHNGKPVSESCIILEYLEDSFPDQVPLMPKGANAHEKSQTRFWVNYLDKESTDFLKNLKNMMEHPEEDHGVEAIVKCIQTVDGAMTEYSAEGPFFTGKDFGVLDVMLAPLAGFLPLAKEAKWVLPGAEEVPRFHKWTEDVLQRKSVGESIPSLEEYVNYIQKRRHKS